jgi:hypothetical protein
LLRTQQLAVKIRESETPQLANSQATDNTVTGIPLEGFRVDFHNGRSLLTVQKRFEYMGGIEHGSHTP